MIDPVLAVMLFRQYIAPELRIVPDLYGSYRSGTILDQDDLVPYDRW